MGTLPTRVFFYGTLMAGFDRRRRAGIDDRLTFLGRGWVSGQLYDVGLYPAAVPATEGRIWGEVYETRDPGPVLEALDAIEGYDPTDADRSLYQRQEVSVAVGADSDAADVTAWIYFYNAPLGHAERILSGDYLAHFRR
jgi:gamma-glutamylcyclotransferase (GGCT)/AIG2-like uncharacterized protein YtfP